MVKHMENKLRQRIWLLDSNSKVCGSDMSWHLKCISLGLSTNNKTVVFTFNDMHKLIEINYNKNLTNVNCRYLHWVMVTRTKR